jgi:CDP-glucose 4,6-dehydratase
MTLINGFKGKRVFLTGHTGFKGAWLTLWLFQLGAEVKGYSLAPESGASLYSRINGDGYCQSVIADIRDKSRLSQEINDFKPDFLFHLAAQPLVRRSYQDPLETWDTNVMGTAAVLDALRPLNQPCYAVIITTDKVYENYNWVHLYRENDRLGGYDPYSASKAACELVIDSYRNSFFNSHRNTLVHIASARAGNVIGGGDWAEDRLIPDLIRAFSANQPLSIRNPGAVRPWQHVLEPLYGYLLLALRLAENPAQFGTSWNFGPWTQDHFTVGEVVAMAQGIWGGGVVNIEQSISNPHEAGLLKLDISKATSLLGWIPRLTGQESIKATLRWYKAVLAGADAGRECLADLEFYNGL